MVRLCHIFAIGCIMTSAIIFAGLNLMDYKLNNIRMMEKENIQRMMVEKNNQRKMMEKLKEERMKGRDRQSLIDDNPDLVFLRKFGRVTNLPTKEEMANMSNKEIEYIYHSYLDNTDFRCKRKIRMGNIGDGGWEVCDDYQYRPIKPCVVYSFGISNDFSFDDDVAKVYGCHVYAFDPSMKQASHDRSAKVHFFKVGISGEAGSLGKNMFTIYGRERWELKTLTSIKAMLKHQNTTLDILKMDIEHAEWTALGGSLQQGELSKVRQLLVEFHYLFDDYTSLRNFMSILQQIEAQGFRRYHTHQNPLGPTSGNIFPVRRSRCYEMYFANTRLARESSSENKTIISGGGRE